MTAFKLLSTVNPLRALLSGIATGALLVFSPPAWSQLKQINDPGITTSFSRDSLKRLTGKTQTLTDAPTSTHNVGYQWVPAGTGGGGELSGITYPSGKQLVYQYDSTGLITGLLWDGQPLISNLKWNPLGQPTSWTWPFTGGSGGTGVTAQRSYNTAGQLVSSETATYTWDAAGRVTQIGQQLFRPQAATNPNNDPSTAPLGVTSTFGYDAAGRLTSVAHTPDTTSMPSPWVIQDIIGPLNTTYSWDANSNRTQASYTNYGGSGLTNSLTRTFTLESGKNRIASVQDTREVAPTGTDTQTHSFDWNASGKLMSYHGGSLVFERDPAGRISAAQAGGSGRTTYQTNALAQRVRKQSNIETTDTVYGDDEAFPGTSSYPLGSYRVATQNGQSINSTEYLYLPTAAGPMPIAMQIGNELLAVHTDHLNTPRRLTDSNGQPAWQWPTSGFGEVEPSTPATGWIRPRLGDAGEIPNTTQISFDLRYPGQQYDKETGLHYNHHRTYDPFLTVGYTEADPLGLNAGWNRFGYVGGNALKWTDPKGLAMGIPGSGSPLFDTNNMCRPVPQIDENGCIPPLVAGGPSLCLGPGALTGTGPALSSLTKEALKNLLGKDQTNLLRQLFGSGNLGANNALANLTRPEGLTNEAINVYRELARRAIEQYERSGNTAAAELQRIRLEILNRLR
jgi:RHS repeat-associated protein